MATKNGSVGQRSDWYKYYLTYSESNVSVANNTSQVTVAVYVECTYPYSGTASTGSGTYKTTLTINGNSYSASKTGMTFKSGTKFELIKKTVTITHSSDGSKSIKISASSTLNDSSGYGPKSGKVSEFSYSLTKIARASSIGSSTPSSCNAGSSVTVYLSVKNSGFNHKVALICGSKTQTISIAAGKTSASFVVDKDFGKQMATVTSKSGTLKLTTYNGSTQVGSAVSKTFTINIPSSVCPSISLLSCTGSNLVSDKYIQNHSSVNISVKQSTDYSIYGGTVTTYILVNGSNKKSFTGTTTESVSVPITASGNVLIQAYSIDSRNRRTPSSGYTTLKTISVESYSSPKISDVSIYRVNTNEVIDEIEGEYARVTYNITYSTCGGVNSISNNTVIIDQKTFSLTSSGNSFETVHNTSYIFSVDLSYNGVISVTDVVGNTATQNITLPSAKVLIDFYHTGHGIAFGKVAEEDIFDVNLKALFRKGVYLMDSANTEYAGVYDNGTNLWIGANQGDNGVHHTGGTYLSSGINTGTGTGNESIRVYIPDKNGDGNYYNVWHKGMTFKKLWGGTWSSGSITVSDFTSYHSFMVQLETTTSGGIGTMVLAFKHPEWEMLRGHGGYRSAAGNFMVYSFAATTSGNTLTWVNCGEIYINKNTTITDCRVIGIYGIM